MMAAADAGSEDLVAAVAVAVEVLGSGRRGVVVGDCQRDCSWRAGRGGGEDKESFIQLCLRRQQDSRGRCRVRCQVRCISRQVL